MLDGYKKAFQNFANFSDRSRRRDYWGFALVNAVVFILLSVLWVTLGANSDGTGYSVVGWVVLIVWIIYGLVVLIPSISVSWRRYQDIGWAGALSILGWFLPLLTFIVALIPGNEGPNQYGPDPKA